MPARPLLYYITNRTMFPGDEAARRRLVLDKIGEAVRCGVDYIQLREKDLSGRELEELARHAMRIVREERESSSAPGRKTRLLINSRTDVAMAVSADGVHLRANDLSMRDVREIVRHANLRNSKLETQNFIVGVSCHSQEEVRAAAADGADFVVFAPIFEKSGASKSGVGLDALAQACQLAIPVFALGGVTLVNARLCLHAGAAGIAGIRLFQRNTIADVVRTLRR